MPPARWRDLRGACMGDRSTGGAPPAPVRPDDPSSPPSCRLPPLAAGPCPAPDVRGRCMPGSTAVLGRVWDGAVGPSSLPMRRRGRAEGSPPPPPTCPKPFAAKRAVYASTPASSTTVGGRASRLATAEPTERPPDGPRVASPSPGSTSRMGATRRDIALEIPHTEGCWSKSLPPTWALPEYPTFLHRADSSPRSPPFHPCTES